MSWLEFIVQMSNAWAWPIFATGAVIFLRKPLKSAATGIVARLSDLRRLKAPGVVLDFEREVRELAQATKELEEGPSATSTVQPEDVVLRADTVDERLTRYRQLAELAPRAAIMQAFTDIEGAVSEKYRQLYPQDDGKVRFARQVDTLRRDGLFDDEIADALLRMAKIRNEAVHYQTEVDVDVANYYVESVANLLGYLSVIHASVDPNPNP